MKRSFLIALAVAALAIFGSFFLPLPAKAADITLLNASYDPTRELYRSLNGAFARYWKAKTGDTVTIRQSHEGSSKQSRAVSDGLEADIVSLALAYDIDALHDRGDLVPANWQSRLPNNASPYTSTVVFVVRKGNPKGIKDWNDLIKPGLQVITPNPKSSGGARWNYLAAWGYALKQNNNDETKARAFVAALFKNVPVLDSGARGATNTYIERGIGDVLIAWESEALLGLKTKSDRFELVVPSISILAEPPVSVVDKVVEQHGTRQVAEEYLKFLYTPEAQTIIAKNFYRPRNPEVAQKFDAQFPKLALFTIDDVFGGWTKAQKTHFNDGGTFDQILTANSK